NTLERLPDCGNIVHKSDTGVLFRRTDPTRTRLRQIGTWDDLRATAFPKSSGRRYRPAEMAQAEPRKQAASRALVAETSTQALVADIEFGAVGLPDVAAVLLLAPHRHGRVLDDARHLWRREIANLGEGLEEVGIAGCESRTQARQV